MTKHVFSRSLTEKLIIVSGLKLSGKLFSQPCPPYIGAEEINRIIKEFYLNREQGVPMPERIEVNLETQHRIDVYAQLRANWERFSDYMWKEGAKMKKPIKLVWNAYNYRSVGQGLRVFNIFDHYSFMESVRKLLKKPMSRRNSVSCYDGKFYTITGQKLNGNGYYGYATAYRQQRTEPVDYRLLSEANHSRTAPTLQPCQPVGCGKD